MIFLLVCVMLSCCLFKQTCRDESKSLRDRPWGKQILRGPYKFTVKTHFPEPPLDPPWGKQILRGPCKCTNENTFSCTSSIPPFETCISGSRSMSLSTRLSQRSQPCQAASVLRVLAELSLSRCCSCIPPSSLNLTQNSKNLLPRLSKIIIVKVDYFSREVWP